MSGSTSHDPAGINRDRIFLIPFAVYALFSSQPVPRAAAGFLAAPPACETDVWGFVAGGDQLRPARAFFRRPAEFDLRSRSHREWQIGARAEK
jgi:hypothetical protein